MIRKIGTNLIAGVYNEPPFLEKVWFDFTNGFNEVYTGQSPSIISNLTQSQEGIRATDGDYTNIKLIYDNLSSKFVENCRNCFNGIMTLGKVGSISVYYDKAPDLNNRGFSPFYFWETYSNRFQLRFYSYSAGLQIGFFQFFNINPNPTYVFPASYFPLDKLLVQTVKRKDNNIYIYINGIFVNSFLIPDIPYSSHNFNIMSAISGTYTQPGSSWAGNYVGLKLYDMEIPIEQIGIF
ncbi:MAG: hypothetical protein LBL18_01355 [Bacteroidales bacterium]|jgi:hypothetical protein|nr:hypothetical protein [Bacteroidales bacterium]